MERAATPFDRKRGPKAEAAHADEERLYGEIGRPKMELTGSKKKSDYERRQRRMGWIDRRRGAGDRAAM